MALYCCCVCSRWHRGLCVYTPLHMQSDGYTYSTRCIHVLQCLRWPRCRHVRQIYPHSSLAIIASFLKCQRRRVLQYVVRKFVGRLRARMRPRKPWETGGVCCGAQAAATDRGIHLPADSRCKTVPLPVNQSITVVLIAKLFSEVDKPRNIQKAANAWMVDYGFCSCALCLTVVFLSIGHQPRSDSV